MKKVLAVGIVSSLLFISFASAATFTTNLSLGTNSNAVKVMQSFLISKNFLKTGATGYFGEQTKKAIQEFQKKNNLIATGLWSLETRQKAESLLSTGVPSATTSQNTVKVSNEIPVKIIPKKVFLMVSVSGSGYVNIPELKTSCSTFDFCKETILSTTKFTLEAIPMMGYSFVSWSEASCGTSKTCTTTIPEDKTITAKFEVTKTERTARITTQTHPTDVCYIPLGREYCDLKFNWESNLAYDITVKYNEVRYYITPDDHTGFPRAPDIDPEEIKKAEAEHSGLPIYFKAYIGTSTLELESHGKFLDGVKVEVKCNPSDYWDGGKCWQKGAGKLVVFKQEHVVIKSIPEGIKCGYSPEACVRGFPGGTSVMLQAIIEPGYVFNGWNNACAGVTTTTCTLIMDKDKTTGVNLKK